MTGSDIAAFLSLAPPRRDPVPRVAIPLPRAVIPLPRAAICLPRATMPLPRAAIPLARPLPRRNPSPWLVAE